MKKITFLLACFCLFNTSIVAAQDNTNIDIDYANQLEQSQAITEFNQQIQEYNDALIAFQTQAGVYVLKDINNQIDDLRNEAIRQLEEAEANGQTDKVQALKDYLSGMDDNVFFNNN